MKSLLLLILTATLALADTGDILGLQVRTATGTKPLTITAPTAGQVLKFSGTPATPLNIGTLATADITGLTSDLALKAPLASPTFTGTVSGITSTMVGLGNVDNTSDANKPVSTAQQTALNLKSDALNGVHTGTASFEGLDASLDVNVGGTLIILGSTAWSTGVGFTYGAGSAANHRTSLGLTALATTTPAANVATFLETPSSSNLRSALTDESGTGEAIFSTTPTFKTSVKVNNPANTFAYTLTPSAIAADRILNIPLTTATDTLATLGMTQTFSGTVTFSGGSTYFGTTYAQNGAAGGNVYSYASGTGKYVGLNATGMKIFTVGADDLNVCTSSSTVHTTFQASGNVLKTTGGRIKLVTVDTGTSLTLTNANHVVTCSNAGAVTVNLPAGVTGTEYIIKNKGAGTVTIDPNSTQELFTTTNVGTLALTTGKAVIIIWDGSHWDVVADY